MILCEKWETKLSIYSKTFFFFNFLAFFMKFFSLDSEEQDFFTKNKKGWITFIQKMERISPRQSILITYLLHKLFVFIFLLLFSILLWNGFLHSTKAMCHVFVIVIAHGPTLRPKPKPHLKWLNGNNVKVPFWA